MTELEVTFLGTGGGWPTVQRNVASVAIQRGGEVVLLDCGEGTQRQIQRSDVSHMRIDRVFISHFHGDHFLGLPGLLQTMNMNDRTEPLTLYGPPGMERIARQILNLGYFQPSYPLRAEEIHEPRTVRCDGFRVECGFVEHQKVHTLGFALAEPDRPGRFDKPKALELGVPEGPLFARLQQGEAVELDDGTVVEPAQVLGPPRPGRRVAYSSDTRPCETMVDLAEGADVLIHDATFASDREEAHEYGHSTAADAARIAKEAGVRKLYLWHISPRYDDPTPLLQEAREIFPATEVAEDLTTVEVPLRDEPP